MMFRVLVSGAVVALALLLAFRLTLRSLSTRRERVLAFLAMGVVPAVWFLAVLGYSDDAMHKTSFCASCHEMGPYYESLLSEDEDSLPASHYRNARVDREKACYECHTRPGLGGLVEAKLKGLHDVKVHYFEEAPEELELHGEYDTAICLKCHAEAASFREGALHQSFMDELLTGETSCLDCHDVGHVLEE
ncbi:MAG: NapC/NirT family cytochrome c [Candidatus Eisenbacteria bacterium]